MSPRRNWDSPTPSFASECAPPRSQKVGGGGTVTRHTRLRLVGGGVLIPTTGEKLSTLPTLCLAPLPCIRWPSVSGWAQCTV